MQGDIKKEMGNWKYTKKHEALINRTLSGLQDPAMSPC
jgi:hypothetical protein